MYKYPLKTTNAINYVTYCIYFALAFNFKIIFHSFLRIIYASILKRVKDEILRKTSIRYSWELHRVSSDMWKPSFLSVVFGTKIYFDKGYSSFESSPTSFIVFPYQFKIKSTSSFFIKKYNNNNNFDYG